MISMKKTFYALLFLPLLLVCGCGSSSHTRTSDQNSTDKNSTDKTRKYDNNRIETLKNWSFQFNKGTNDYSLFFGLLNKNNEFICADVNVHIRIVNEYNEEVYMDKKSVFKNDFGSYTSQAKGEQYLAELRIPAADIAPGKSSNGTVYLTVYNEETYFDEVNCSAFYCLPISDVNLTFDALPLSINVKGFDGNTESTIQIDDISYSYEKEYPPQITITISGTKIYGRTSSLPGYDRISYKLYDSEEYMVTSGIIYLDSLTQGDKFKDDSVIIYDITPGETYRLILSEYN